jgi:hypothetical protein
MNAGQPSGGLGQGVDKRGGQGQGQASAGGLILDVSGAMAESMGLKLGEGSGKPKNLGFPHDMIEGEMQSLRAIAETKSVRRQVIHPILVLHGHAMTVAVHVGVESRMQPISTSSFGSRRHKCGDC